MRLLVYLLLAVITEQGLGIFVEISHRREVNAYSLRDNLFSILSLYKTISNFFMLMSFNYRYFNNFFLADISAIFFPIISPSKCLVNRLRTNRTVTLKLCFFLQPKPLLFVAMDNLHKNFSRTDLDLGILANRCCVINNFDAEQLLCCSLFIGILLLLYGSLSIIHVQNRFKGIIQFSIYILILPVENEKTLDEFRFRKNDNVNFR